MNMKITDIIRNGYKKLAARNKGANKRCGDNYQEDMISPSRVESTISEWDKMANQNEGLERMYRSTSIVWDEDDEDECRGDIPSPLGLDSVVVPPRGWWETIFI